MNLTKMFFRGGKDKGVVKTTCFTVVTEGVTPVQRGYVYLTPSSGGVFFLRHINVFVPCACAPRWHLDSGTYTQKFVESKYYDTS